MWPRRVAREPVCSGMATVPRNSRPIRAGWKTLLIAFLLFAAGVGLFVLGRSGAWKPGFLAGGSLIFLGVAQLVTSSWRFERGLWMLYAIPCLFAVVVAVAMSVRTVTDAMDGRGWDALWVNVLITGVWYMALYLCASRAVLNWSGFRNGPPPDEPPEFVGAGVPRVDEPPDLSAQAVARRGE